MQLSCEDFHYDSAHYLPEVPEGHKCGNMHGHTYRLKVTLDGPVREDGFVVDFGEVKKAVKPLIDQLDHRLINDIIGNPTVEHQLIWFAAWLAPQIEWLYSLTLYEGLNNSATYVVPR